MTEKKQVVTVIGLGVIGGSYAMALKKLGYTVYGVDCDDDTVAKAKERGIADDAATSAEAFVPLSDIVVIALYPKQVEGELRKIRDFLKEGVVVTDVAGIKSHFTQKILALMPADTDFVFAHPMAGREKKGIDYADDRVFKGANFIITPSESNKKSSLETVERLAREMGFKNVMRLTPEQHDKIISFVSQLPHALAVALVNSDDRQFDTPRFVGDSYRDLTRIANINESLWSELFLGNKDNLLSSIREFEKCLEVLKEALENEDKETLEREFVRATKRRTEFNKEL